MKKSNIVKLVLVTSLFSACHPKEDKNSKAIYLRTGTESVYTMQKVPRNKYVEFNSYDLFSTPNAIFNPTPGTYVHGYHSYSLHANSSAYNHHVSRGGFGSSSFKTGS